MNPIYHILNRGVDKRKIFLDEQDYFRFIHDLYEFNDENSVCDIFHTFHTFHSNKSWDFVSPKPRSLIVDIYAFCLMPNHYHLFLSPLIENGITKFMRKLNIGYAKYFNEKYNRSGALFEGRYKSIAVTSDAHFLYLPFYIHCNPLDMFDGGWRNGELKDFDKAINFLESYRWSSHLDYLGKKNFPSIINKSMLLDVFGGQGNYKKDIYNWLKGMELRSNINDIQPFLLEK